MPSTLHPTATASAQSTLWNGPSGEAWVSAQAVLDRMFLPFAERLAEIVAASEAEDVLDVGCGTGATTLAAAARLRSGGTVTGIDISAPMLAAARRRAAQASVAVDFVLADAQRHVFADNRHDLLISRFGVMFFDDPVVAFANLRQAMRAGGSLCALAWRSPAENPFMTAAERAAEPLLPALPPRRPDEPGQFAFADAARVQGILAEAGWSGLAIEALDVDCGLPEDDLPGYYTRLGPLGLALRSADAETRSRIVERVQAAFAPFVQNGEARFTAACWTIRATA